MSNRLAEIALFISAADLAATAGIYVHLNGRINTQHQTQQEQVKRLDEIMSVMRQAMIVQQQEIVSLKQQLALMREQGSTGESRAGRGERDERSEASHDRREGRDEAGQSSRSASEWSRAPLSVGGDIREEEEWVNEGAELAPSQSRLSTERPEATAPEGSDTSVSSNEGARDEVRVTGDEDDEDFDWRE
jgi:hypothetical protein